MVECCPNSQLQNVPSVGKASKMSGVDAKHSDRFSNASLLSILTRSYAKTTPVTSNSSTTSTLNPNSNVGNNSNVNSSKVSPTPRSSQFFGKESDKSPTLLSRFSITSGLGGQNSTKGLTQRISKGPGSNIYQIGAEIGRGGYAVVYQAFNVETGDFVAIKRIPLSSVDDETLCHIQGEIDLMRRLNHPHIVEYYDTVRTEGHLNIVLEYVESGSLCSVLKKFGFFSESLAAIYVTQILKGLKYLHDMGVIHRDIKGANLLTTKDGVIKLADFGVALRQSETGLYPKSSAQDRDVVGSPYWIAPEIIEMIVPTTACDIWSVGCTVIELLTGKPPYFNRPPMAALFSIVQDDCPPLPEGISSDVRDFLTLCFQKNPTLRSTAEVLLNHPWLISGREKRQSVAERTHTSSTRSLAESSSRSTAIKSERRTIVERPSSGNRSERNERSKNESKGDEKSSRRSYRQEEILKESDGDHLRRGNELPRTYSFRRSSNSGGSNFPIVSREINEEDERERQMNIAINVKKELENELTNDKYKDKEGRRYPFKDQTKESKYSEENHKAYTSAAFDVSPPIIKFPVINPLKARISLSEKLSDRISKKPSNDSDFSRKSSKSELLFETSTGVDETDVVAL